MGCHPCPPGGLVSAKALWCWLWSMCLEPQGSGWRQVPGSLVPLGGFWPPWELFYGIKSPFILKQQIFYRILYFHGFSSHSKIPAWQTCIKEVCCFPFLKGGSWCQDGYCNHVASCNHCHGILRLSQANRCRREAAWSVQQLGDHYRKQVIDMWFSDFAPRHIMIRIWRIWWGSFKTRHVLLGDCWDFWNGRASFCVGGMKMDFCINVSRRSGASRRFPRSRRPESNFSVDVDLAWKEPIEFQVVPRELEKSLSFIGATLVPDLSWFLMCFSQGF